MKRVLWILLALSIITQTITPIIPVIADGETPISIFASFGDGEQLGVTLDNKSDTAWIDASLEAFITYEFAAYTHFSSIGIHWSGIGEEYEFKISLSSDDYQYEDVFSGKSIDSSDVEIYSFAESGGHFLKISASSFAGLGISEVLFNPIPKEEQQKAIPEPTRTVAVQNVPKDIMGTDLETPVQLLKKLNLIDFDPGVSYYPDSKVTHGEFLQIILKLYKQESQILTDFGKNSFIQGLGIELDEEDGTFNPDCELTYIRAIATAVTILGYKVQVDSFGGFPLGCLIVAENINLTSRLSRIGGVTISRGDMTMLLYNLIHCKIFEPTHLSNQGAFEYEQTVTFMEKHLELNRGSGRIVANDMTPISSQYKKSNKGFVTILDSRNKLIANGMYRTKDSAADELIGYNVIYYYNLQNNDPELIFVQTQDGQNNVVRITADRFINASSNSSGGGTIFYENETGRSVSKNISTLDVIYNGKFTSAYHMEDLNDAFIGSDNDRKTGEIVLVESPSENTVLMLIYAYDDYFLEYVSQDERFSLGIYKDNPISLEGKKEGDDYRVYKGGKQVEFSDIAAFDVISVAQSYEQDYMEIVVSSDTIVGTVSEMQEGPNQVKINNIYYRYANMPLKMRLGNSGTFHFNFQGKIVGVSGVASDSIKVGVLLDLYPGNGGLSKGQARILTSSGGYISFNLADTVTVTSYANGNRTITRCDPKKVGQAGGLIGNGSSFFWNLENNDSKDKNRRLITYTMNQEGEINSMQDSESGAIFANGAPQATPDGSHLVEIANSQGAIGTGEANTLNYRPSARAFGGLDTGKTEVCVDTDTIVFFIPSMVEGTLGRDEPSDYKTTSIDKIVTYYSYGVNAYSLDDRITAQYLILRYNEPQSLAHGVYTWPLIITKFSVTYDENNMEKIKVYGMQNGEEVSYILADKKVITNRISTTGNTTGGVVRDVGFTMANEIGIATATMEADFLGSNTGSNNDLFQQTIQKTRVLPGDVAQLTIDHHTGEIMNMFIMFDGSRPKTQADYQSKGLSNLNTINHTAHTQGYVHPNQRIFGKVVSKKGNYVILEVYESLRYHTNGPIYIPVYLSNAVVSYVRINSKLGNEYSKLIHHSITGNASQDSYTYVTNIVKDSTVKYNVKKNAEDISVGDEIFVRQYGLNIRDVIVFEWE